MSVKMCHIIGAGDFSKRDALRIAPGEFVVAADAGVRHAADHGIMPGLIVGDFDSVGKSEAEALFPGVPTVTFPSVKDDTDTMLAAREGLARGFTEFSIYGVVGNRIDHMLAAFSVLSEIERRGGRAAIYSQGTTVRLVRSSRMEIPAFDGYVSVFPYGGPAFGVSLDGVKYPLKGVNLDGDSPLGVSNEITGDRETITVEKGTLIVITSERGG